MEHYGPFALQILQIIWVDLLLSGDNAVVIALACRALPERQRKIGVILGAGAAVALRVLFLFIVVQLLALPYLRIVGGVLLLIIAVQLILGDEDSEHDVKAQPNLIGAVTTIAIADAVMSLDNVVAIAGIARDHMGLMIFGVLLSIPFVVFGAGALMRMIERFPIIVWAGGALLGWVAGQMIAEEPFVHDWLARIGPVPPLTLAALGATLTIAIALVMKRGANDRN
ncbi:MAG: TerC family protein [Hyphomicrobiales bacterium]|nr:TerC family protein [Hyphomicrobiales bacterium]